MAVLAALLGIGGLLVLCSYISAPDYRGVRPVGENNAPTKADVLSLYRSCERASERHADPIAAMGMFVIRMDEVGPRAVPGLIAILDEPEVQDTWVFDAIL